MSHKTLFPSSLCPPSPFLYNEINDPKPSDLEITSQDNTKDIRHIRPLVRANRLIAYLQSLKQDYELPEVSFVEDDEVVEETELTKEVASAQVSSAPKWLQDQIDAGKEVYMKAAAGGDVLYLPPSKW